MTENNNPKIDDFTKAQVSSAVENLGLHNLLTDEDDLAVLVVYRKGDELICRITSFSKSTAKETQ